MSTEFLSEKRLAREIANVVGGGKVRCAVAYWGTGAVKHQLGSGADCQPMPRSCATS